MLSVRPAAVDDIDAMYLLDCLCFDPPFRVGRSEVEEYVTGRGYSARVASRAESLIGFAVTSESVCFGKAGYLVTLDVHPAYRRSGVARCLLSNLEQSAAASGALAMWLHVYTRNRSAIGFYEALGYQRSRRHGRFYPGRRDAWVYIKPLSDEVAQQNVLSTG